MFTTGPSCKIVDRLAFPHASLGQVQSDLATKLCVLYLCPFLKVVFLLPKMYGDKGRLRQT